MTPPRFVLAFANDRGTPGRSLRNLQEEFREILKALERPAEAGRLVVDPLHFATAPGLFDAFRRSESRGPVALLHFAGHADSYHLLLEDTDGTPAAVSGGGLAGFLGHVRGLQLVFLNGCATQGHVQDLLDAGVPAVISTSRAVDDGVARDFAVRFYMWLGEGRSLREAYERATQELRALRLTNGRTWRHLYVSPSGDGHPPFDSERPPWDLSIRPGAERVEMWAPGTPPLPPVPRRDLPERPFRHLHRFGREHAELFFGREREIWELYERVVADDAPPVILLYGQSGVGKSSLLEAGLLPRLEGDWEVRYVRRDAGLGLLGTLAHTLAVDGSGTECMGRAWRRVEDECGRPLLVVLDQVEEAFTRAADPERELAELAGALGELFRNRGSRPRGKLVLGFRKEWLAEVESALGEGEVPRKAQFLPRLSREGIVAAITGVERDRRLHQHYGLAVEEGLAGRIADDLLRDEESHIAPLLQILLSGMWDAAVAVDRSRPRFDGDLYESLTLYRADREQKLLLDDFLGEQLATLRSRDAAAVDAGLALDYLAFHTTRFGTARERTSAETNAEYPHRRDAVGALRRYCTDLYLLADPPSDSDDGAETPGTPPTRLAHDTLAPLVRRRYEESMAPGQRARSILEGRAADWSAGRTGAPLDETDLAIVESGESGMRAWAADERRLIDQSRLQRARRLRQRRILRVALSGLAMLVLVFAGFGWWQFGEAEDRRREAESRELSVQASSFLNEKPDFALLASVAAYDREPTQDARAALGNALASVSPHTRAMLRSGQPQVRSLAFSPTGEHLAAIDWAGEVVIWHVQETRKVKTLVITMADSTDGNIPEMQGAAFSPDGRWLAVRGRSFVALFDAPAYRLHGILRVGDAVTKAFSFSPDSRLLAVSSGPGDRCLILWDFLARKAERLDVLCDGLALAFDSRAGILALGSRLGTITLIDVYSKKALKTFQAFREQDAYWRPITGMAFSPSGAHLALSSDGVIEVWRAGDWERAWKEDEWKQTPPMYVRGWSMLGDHAIAFESDSVLVIPHDRYLVSVESTGGPNYMYSGMRGTFKAHKAPVISIAMSPDGKTLASGDASGLIVLWNVARGVPWRDIDETLKGPAGIAERVERWPDFSWAALSPTGRSLAFADSAGIIRWDLDRNLLARQPSTALLRGVKMAIDRSGRRLAFADSSSVRIADASGDLIISMGSRSTTRGTMLALSHDGSALAFGGPNSAVVFGRLTPGGLTRSTLPDSVTPTSISVSPDGGLVAVGDHQGRVLLWNSASKRFERHLAGHRSEVRLLTFSLDGHLLTAAYADGRILLWNLSKQRMPAIALAAHRDTITALAFSADGNSFAAGDRYGTVTLWDTRGRLLMDTVKPRNFGRIVGVAFADADSRLIFAGITGQVEASDIRAGTWMERACRLANWDTQREEWNRLVPNYEFPRHCRRRPAAAAR